MSDEEQHHAMGPSALKYIEICPGFRSTNETNIYAEEGTKLHEACEKESLEGLDEEQVRLVTSCLAYTAALEKDADEVHKELRVEIKL